MFSVRKVHDLLGEGDMRSGTSALGLIAPHRPFPQVIVPLENPPSLQVRAQGPSPQSGEVRTVETELLKCGLWQRPQTGLVSCAKAGSILVATEDSEEDWEPSTMSVLRARETFLVFAILGGSFSCHAAQPGCDVTYFLSLAQLLSSSESMQR